LYPATIGESSKPGWSREPDVSPDQLRELVAKQGILSADVRKLLASIVREEILSRSKAKRRGAISKETKQNLRNRVWM